MDILIHPRKLSGSIAVIPSKSLAHRFLICAAMGEKPVFLVCPETSDDIEATAAGLCALGADVQRVSDGYRISPVERAPAKASLSCRESGSTLRFLLPLAGALGITTTFRMEGRLAERPLSPLLEEMERMGCKFSHPEKNTLVCEGKLRPGKYTITGNISSQFISGLLMALKAIGNNASLEIAGKVESLPYVEMTRHVLDIFSSMDKYPDTIYVEGDWSNGAFWLAANALGGHVSVENLNPQSIQGDRCISFWLSAIKKHCVIPAQDIPDLVPILSVAAAANQGAVFTGIHRLRMKESDRIASTSALIQSLGGQAQATEDTLTISGGGLTGGIVDSFHDHRIAMSAAIASTVCTDAVLVRNAECVQKSYPRFWDEFHRLGGSYEQHLR